MYDVKQLADGIILFESATAAYQNQLVFGTSYSYIQTSLIFQDITELSNICEKKFNLHNVLFAQLILIQLLNL